jgi:hypothetical protein
MSAGPGSRSVAALLGCAVAVLLMGLVVATRHSDKPSDSASSGVTVTSSLGPMDAAFEACYQELGGILRDETNKPGDPLRNIFLRVGSDTLRGRVLQEITVQFETNSTTLGLDKASTRAYHRIENACTAIIWDINPLTDPAILQLGVEPHLLSRSNPPQGQHLGGCYPDCAPTAN